MSTNFCATLKLQLNLGTINTKIKLIIVLLLGSIKTINQDILYYHQPTFCMHHSLVSEVLYYVVFPVGKIRTPGGVLRYISDGDVRSPFLGLKFEI